MRKANLVLVFLVLAMVISGCSEGKKDREQVPQVGDFSFELPEGFTISDVTEKSCSILDAYGVAVGRFQLTGLTTAELWDDDDGALPRYFNEVAYGCEYFGWKGGDEEYPLHYISLYFTDPDTQERLESCRVLFVKDGGVYDMWLDREKLDGDTITEFEAIAERKGN